MRSHLRAVVRRLRAVKPQLTLLNGLEPAKITPAAQRNSLHWPTPDYSATSVNAIVNVDWPKAKARNFCVFRVSGPSRLLTGRAAWNRDSSAAGGRAEHDARHIVRCEDCPQTGRTFATRETQSGHESVMLLINSLWREQFQGDLGILGK
jgi:hypothetical protein